MIQKSAIVTGANKGIGLQIAKELGERDFYVFLAARSRGKGEAAFRELEKSGIKGQFLQMDISKPESIYNAFEEVSKVTNNLDVIINNAGVLFDRQYDFLTIPPEVSLETIQTNTLGALWVTQTFLSLLSQGSRIVMMSSGAGEFCSGLSTWGPVYATSKTALNAITRQLHVALEPKGIIINAMCPGWVQTDMGGRGADRTLEKGAETAVWLSTEAPEDINGKFLRDKQEISW